MTKFEIRDCTSECMTDYKHFENMLMSVKAGVAADEDASPKTIETFDTEEEARKDLEKRRTDVRFYRSNAAGRVIVWINEYAIMKAEYTEDGDFDQGNYIEFSEMPEELTCTEFGFMQEFRNTGNGYELIETVT